MNCRKRSGLLTSTAFLALTALLVPNAAQAQSASGSEIETVTVTATKVTERQIDVPIPVTAINADTLVENNNTHLEDYVSQIPSLSIASQGNGRSAAIIRGISTGVGNNNPTVAITIDDVPIGSSTASGIGDALLPDIDPSVLQSVEVLRGPQGSLYGASSMGGLIRYVTSTPDLDETYGSAAVSGTAAAHGSQGGGVRAFVNTPIVKDTLGMQLSGFYRQDPGYVDNLRTNHDDFNVSRTTGGRAAFLWQITPNVSYELAAILQTRKSDGSSRVDVSFDRVPLNDSFYQVDRIPGTNRGSYNMAVYSGTLKANLGFADLSSVTSFTRSAFNGPQDASASFDRYLGYIYDADVVGSLDSRIDDYKRTGKFTQEIRLASQSGGSLEWMVGGFLTRETSLIKQAVYPVLAADGTRYDTNNLYTIYDPDNYREYAAFGSATYHFTPSFDLELGARISAQAQHTHSETGGLLNGGTTVDIGNQSANVFTYAITPRYHINEDMMVYARVATGYRPGGPNSAPGAPTSFGPDRTVNYEIGFKGIVIDNLMTVDASLFDIEWSNIQIETATVDNFNYIENGSTARSRGFELATMLTPGDGWSISANFSFVDATLRQDVSRSTLYGKKGERLPFSSKTSGSISVDKTVPLFADWKGFAGMTFAYQGSRYAAYPSSAAYSRFFMPAYGTLGLRAGVEYDTWKLSVYASNVLDQVGFTYAQSRNAATRTGQYDAAIIAPRTVGISLAKKF